MKNNTVKTAFCSVIIALGVCVMLLASFLTTISYSCAAIAGLLLLVIKLEFGTPHSLISFFIMSVLAFLFVPAKEVVVAFIALFGYYPILKFYIDKIKSKIFNITVKLVLVNIVAILGYLAMKYLFFVPDAEFTVFGVYLPGLVLLFLNVVFLVYDYAINGLIVAYNYRIRKLISKYLKF